MLARLVINVSDLKSRWNIFCGVFRKQLMKKAALLSGALFSFSFAHACVTCNRSTQEAIFDSTFYPNLLVMLSAFIAVGIIVIVLSILATRRYKLRAGSYPGQVLLSPVPLATAATVCGIGLGGFIDGIVFHQVLQWHELLSNKIPPVTLEAKSVNMFWDGIFHAFTLVTTFVGILLLWKILPRQNIDRSGKVLAGGLILGWGLFNIVEGIIDHQILKLHNVKEVSANPEAWNYGFLAASVLFIIIGTIMTKGENAPRRM
jgi:uncharacterized membrane protein